MQRLRIIVRKAGDTLLPFILSVILPNCEPSASEIPFVLLGSDAASFA